VREALWVKRVVDKAMHLVCADELEKPHRDVLDQAEPLVIVHSPRFQAESLLPEVCGRCAASQGGEGVHALVAIASAYRTELLCERLVEARDESWPVV
jgi:hypothetical protein